MNREIKSSAPKMAETEFIYSSAMSDFGCKSVPTPIEADDRQAQLRAPITAAVRKELDGLGMMELYARIKGAGCYNRLALESRMVAERMEEVLRND